MSCGLESLVLALQLARELVDRPWGEWGSSSMTLEYSHPVPPWANLRIQADFAEARDKKLREFHELADLCLPKTTILGSGDLFATDAITYDVYPTGKRTRVCRPDPSNNDEYKCE